MTALATVDDIAAVSRAVPDEEVDQVERLLEMVSAWVRRYTGQTFDLVEDDEVTVWPVDGEVWLPQRPVIEVTSVSENDLALAATGYEALANGRLHRRYLTERQAWTRAPLTITYTHGYESTPDDIVMVVAEVAAARWNAASVNPMQIAGSRSSDVAGYSESQSFNVPSLARDAWSATHKEILDSYRRARSGSVRITS